MKRSTFQTLVAVELARRGWTQRDLAARLRLPDTTLSDWIRGVRPGPADLSRRLELTLDLPPGMLSPNQEPKSAA